jgi:hypothetical protein
VLYCSDTQICQELKVQTTHTPAHILKNAEVQGSKISEGGNVYLHC